MMSSRTVGTLLCGVAISAMGFASAFAQGTPAVKGGIKGKVAKVDAEKGTLTITKQDGTEQTFNVTKDTTIVGPRSGAVRQGLKDPRFHEGFVVTVVATDDNAKEIHLGTARPQSGALRMRGNASFRGTEGATSAARPKASETTEATDIAGTIKSLNASKHLLVVTLTDGTERSFMVPKTAKVSVGDTVSENGLSDAPLKAGMSVTIVTEGRKVKEVKATARSLKKAG
jgi:hypothetical protein